MVGLLGLARTHDAFSACTGPPQLMMAFTEDGQADPLVIAKRDALYNSNSADVKKHRASTLDFSHQPSKEADHWVKGNGSHQLMLLRPACCCGCPIDKQHAVRYGSWQQADAE